MDRFIDFLIHDYFFAKTYLKSNMDRFIAAPKLARGKKERDLKSNMDRFIDSEPN